MDPRSKKWFGGLRAAAINSLFDGGILGGGGGALSLAKNHDLSIKMRLIWAAIHVVCLVGGNAMLDMRAWVKNGHPFPSPYDDAIPAPSSEQKQSL